MINGAVTSFTLDRDSQSGLISANDFGVTFLGTSCVGGTSDPSSTEGLAGTGGDNSGFGDEEPTNRARDQRSHAGMRQSEGEEGPSRRQQGKLQEARRQEDFLFLTRDLGNSHLQQQSIYNYHILLRVTDELFTNGSSTSKRGTRSVSSHLFSYSWAEQAEEWYCLSFSFNLMSARVENFSRASKRAWSVSANRILSEGVH